MYTWREDKGEDVSSHWMTLRKYWKLKDEALDRFWACRETDDRIVCDEDRALSKWGGGIFCKFLKANVFCFKIWERKISYVRPWKVKLNVTFYTGHESTEHLQVDSFTCYQPRNKILWMTRLTSRPFYLRVKSSRQTVIRNLCRPQSKARSFAEKSVASAGSRTVDLPDLNVVNLPTAISNE